MAVGTNFLVAIRACIHLAARLAGDRLTLRALGGTNLAAALFVAFLATHEYLLLVAFLLTGATHGFTTAVARNTRVETELRVTLATLHE